MVHAMMRCCIDIQGTRDRSELLIAKTMMLLLGSPVRPSGSCGMEAG